MKNLLFFFTLFLCIEARAEKGFSKKYQTSWVQATARARRLSLRPDDATNLIEYMEYYSSWYAGVTPAPVALYEKLSPQAEKFIKDIKQIVKPLERKPNRRLMGGTRLSNEGRTFYKNFIYFLRQYF